MYCFSSQLSFCRVCLVCSSAGSFNKRAFKPIACVLNVNCSSTRATHTCGHTPTLPLLWQRSTICVYQARYFVLITIVQHTIAVTCCCWESSRHYTIQHLMQKRLPLYALCFFIGKHFWWLSCCCFLCAGLLLAPQKRDSGSLWSQDHCDSRARLLLNLSRFSGKCFHSSSFLF